MSISSTLNLIKRKPNQTDSQPSTSATKRLKSSGGLSDIPDSMAPAPRTPSKMDSQPIIPINQETPEKPKVENQSNLKSPQWYHDPNQISPFIRKENKEFRKLIKNLDGKKVKRTLILSDSPKKDPERIRSGEIPQNEKGLFEVRSESREGSRLWGAHEKSLHPIKGRGECDKDLVTLKGSDLKTLIEEPRPEGKKFKDHLLDRVELPEKK